MTVKIQLVDNQHGAGKDVIVHGQFNVGRLYENQPGNRSVVLSFDVSKVKEALRQNLRQHIPSEFMGDYDQDLIEYVKLCMLEQIGVTSHPIVKKDGVYEGFKDYDVMNPVTEDTRPISMLDEALADVRQGAFDKDNLTFILEMAREYMVGSMKV